MAPTCTPTACQWVIGMTVSLVVGAIVVSGIVWSFHCLGRVHWRLTPKGEVKRERAPQEIWFTVLFGGCERLAITFIAIYSLEGAGAFSLAWIGLKLASWWNRPGRNPAPEVNESEEALEIRRENLRREARGSLTSLIGSLASVFFAIWGALIVCGRPLVPM